MILLLIAMSKLAKFILPTVLVALMVLASSQVVFAATELAYDDDDPDSSVTMEAGRYLAVIFSLPDGWSSARLLKARYYIYSLTAFRVHIFGSDGVTELLTPPLDVTPSGTGWFDVDLTAYNIVVSGDFLIAIEYETQWNPPIGLDLTAPDARSVYDPPGTWHLQVDPRGDYMIRAVVEQVSRPVGGVLTPVNKLTVLVPYLALIGLVGAVTVAFAVTRRQKPEQDPLHH